MSDFSLPHLDVLRLAAASVATAVLLAGCATPRSAELPEIATWNARTTVLAGLNEWEFSGRIAVKTDVDGFNGKLRWVQDENEFSAIASGPFGASAVRIEGDAQTVTITDKEGIQTELGSAEAEFRHRYGWSIPIASLRYWALGIPDPAAPAETELNGAGQLLHMTQRGWSVSFSRYAEGGGQLMPKVLSAENSDTRVRLVIDHWIFFD